MHCYNVCDFCAAKLISYRKLSRYYSTLKGKERLLQRQIVISAQLRNDELPAVWYNYFSEIRFMRLCTVWYRAPSLTVRSPTPRCVIRSKESDSDFPTPLPLFKFSFLKQKYLTLTLFNSLTLHVFDLGGICLKEILEVLENLKFWKFTGKLGIARKEV